jgi:hypothetical protein
MLGSGVRKIILGKQFQEKALRKAFQEKAFQHQRKLPTYVGFETHFLAMLLLETHFLKRLSIPTPFLATLLAFMLLRLGPFRCAENRLAVALPATRSCRMRHTKMRQPLSLKRFEPQKSWA